MSGDRIAPGPSIGDDHVMSPSTRAMLADDRASRTLGITVDFASEGEARARMTVRADMSNGYGAAHGGLIFALADTAFASACNSFGPITVAAAAEIVFVSPARAGDELVATAALRTGFGRTGIYDVTVRCGERVVAEFRGRAQQVPVAGTINQGR